jgi:hypothetical protein
MAALGIRIVNFDIEILLVYDFIFSDSILKFVLKQFGKRQRLALINVEEMTQLHVHISGFL